MAPPVLIIQAVAIIVRTSDRAVDSKLRSAQDTLLALIEQNGFLIATSTTLTAEEASDVIDAAMGTKPASVVPPKAGDREVRQQTCTQARFGGIRITPLRRQIEADPVTH